MNDESKMKIIKVLEMIVDDCRKDAQSFEGKPFNGKTVAEYFGNQGAQIATLANIIQKTLVENIQDKTGPASYAVSDTAGCDCLTCETIRKIRAERS